jgi:hypothetical protein
MTTSAKATNAIVEAIFAFIDSSLGTGF